MAFYSWRVVRKMVDSMRPVIKSLNSEILYPDAYPTGFRHWL